jgi:predicted lipoprotein with Yx(FWY)xxD motif
MALPLLALAGMVMPPDVPLDVQVIQEEGRYVLRTFDLAKPLYTHDGDRAGAPACLGRCAVAWPPLRVSARARARAVGRWTVVTRPDNGPSTASRSTPSRATLTRGPQAMAAAASGTCCRPFRLVSAS